MKIKPPNYPAKKIYIIGPSLKVVWMWRHDGSITIVQIGKKKLAISTDALNEKKRVSYFIQ